MSFKLYLYSEVVQKCAVAAMVLGDGFLVSCAVSIDKIWYLDI